MGLLGWVIGLSQSIIQQSQERNVHALRFFFVFSCTLYFIRACVFILIVLHFAFLSNTRNTNIHALGWVRSRNPSKRSTVDSRLRPLSHWYRCLVSCCKIQYEIRLLLCFIMAVMCCQVMHCTRSTHPVCPTELPRAFKTGPATSSCRWMFCNIEARSRNHRCRGKGISITCSSACVCVCACAGMGAGACACAHVALLIQHASRRHIVICGLSVSTTSLRHYVINGTIFGKNVTQHEMCVLISYTIFTWMCHVIRALLLSLMFTCIQTFYV